MSTGRLIPPEENTTPCSFCGLVGRRIIVAGMTDIAICRDCVNLALEIFTEEDEQYSGGVPS